MPHTPPTSPLPLPPAAARRPSWIVLSLTIHAALVFITCFSLPIAMDSNIWPIAGVFWSVFTVPVAAGTGALVGWLVKKQKPPVAFPILICTAIALSIVVGFIMANNR